MTSQTHGQTGQYHILTETVSLAAKLTKIWKCGEDSAKALEQIEFIETLRYNATTTTAVLSSVTHASVISPQCLSQAQSPV